MSIASTRLISADEFFDFVHRPENRDRMFELEHGEIVEMPLPGQRHGAVCANITFLFGLYTRQIKRGQAIGNDSGLVIGRDPDTVRGPDIALFTDIINYADLSTKYSDEMPTVAVEVLSPSDSRSRMTRRLNRYLDSGVTLVWLVDPDDRTVQIWWKDHAPVVFEDGEEIANLPALPDFRCKVTEIFDAPGT